jgi:hypothetical protein
LRLRRNEKSVIPANAGIHGLCGVPENWIPAFAGMTRRVRGSLLFRTTSAAIERDGVFAGQVAFNEENLASNPETVPRKNP